MIRESLKNHKPKGAVWRKKQKIRRKCLKFEQRGKIFILKEICFSFWIWYPVLMKFFSPSEYLLFLSHIFICFSSTAHEHTISSANTKIGVEGSVGNMAVLPLADDDDLRKIAEAFLETRGHRTTKLQLFLIINEWRRLLKRIVQSNRMNWIAF